MLLNRLTSVSVESLRCPPGRRHQEIPDTFVRGFFVDALPSGRKSYRLRFTLEGKRHVITIGDATLIGLDEARFQARDVLRGLRRGETPQALRGTGGPLIRDFFLGPYLDYVKGYKRSWITDESVIRNHLLPDLGNRMMGSVQAIDIVNVVRGMQSHEYAAATINRMLVLLSYGYKLAIKWKVPRVFRNPAADVEHLRIDNRIERYLSDAETQRLLHQVRSSPNPVLGSIVAFLILTGARKREALSMRWSEVDIDRRLWRISRTKSGRTRHMPLSDAAVQVLAQVRHQNDPNASGPYVFPNPKTGEPFVSIFNSWDSARKRAGMPDLRLHDLRHSFASFLVNAGRSLYEVQELLGHADARTTARYAHLSPDRLRQAVQSVGAIVAR